MFLILLEITTNICFIVPKFVFGYKISGLFVGFEIGKLIIGDLLGFKDIKVSPDTKSFCHKKSG